MGSMIFLPAPFSRMIPWRCFMMGQGTAFPGRAAISTSAHFIFPGHASSFRDLRYDGRKNRGRIPCDRRAGGGKRA